MNEIKDLKSALANLEVQAKEIADRFGVDVTVNPCVGEYKAMAFVKGEVVKPQYREAKRAAKSSEKIKVVGAWNAEHRYKDGDILTVWEHIEKKGHLPHVIVCEFSYPCVLDTEYVVLEEV